MANAGMERLSRIIGLQRAAGLGAVFASDPPRGPFLVSAGCGDTDTGFHAGWPITARAHSLDDAQGLLQHWEAQTLEAFSAEISKIASGVSDGVLVNDGTEQFMVALAAPLTASTDKRTPVAGVAVRCNAALTGSLGFEPYDVNDAWEGILEEIASDKLAGSLVPYDTIQAYRDAHYEVLSTPAFRLTVDTYSHDLDRLYAGHFAQTAAFLTACNPLGVITHDGTNKECQRQMERDIAALGHRVHSGIGLDPTGEWEGEPSLLVLGISQKNAEALGHRYSQNAIIFAGKDAVPRLLMLR